MKTSETIKNLSAALLKAQKNIGAATKGAANPFFKSKYADLGSVMEACKGALNEEGITVLQPVQSSTEGDFVETLLLHESGEFISSTMKLVLSKQDMQAYGSAVSYARRYSLQSLMFIPAEDDDGEKSVQRHIQHKEPTKPVKSEVGTTISMETSVKLDQPVTTIEESKPAASRTTFRGRAPAVKAEAPVATSVNDPSVPKVSGNKMSHKMSLNF